MRPAIERIFRRLAFLFPLAPLAPACTTPSVAESESAVEIPPFAGELAADPLRLESNHGQWANDVRFGGRGAGYHVFLTDSPGLVLLLSADTPDKTQGTAVRLSLSGGAESEPVGEDPLPGASNYLRGADAAAFITHVPAFGRVRYSSALPGIDLVFAASEGRRVELHLRLSPGSDAGALRLVAEGATPSFVDGDGNAVLDTAVGPLLLEAPIAWQIGENGEEPVEIAYVLDGAAVRLALGFFDPERELFIDPVIAYQLSVGGSDADGATAVAADAAGNAYVAGHTRSTDFPTTPGAFDQTVSSFFDADDAFVMKRDATGALVWSTALGGSDSLASDRATSIALDSLLQPVVAGWTRNCYFAGAPTPCSTTIPILTQLGHPNAFLATLTADGSGIVFARNFGGVEDDRAQGVAVGADGAIHVVGRTSSTDFPNAGRKGKSDLNPYPDYSYNGGEDAFLVRYSSTGTLQRAGYFGGSGDDDAVGVAIDAAGRLHIAGTTFSSDFPVTDFTPQGRGDIFSSRFDASGRTLEDSRTVGGVSTEEVAAALSLDEQGRSFVAGTRRQLADLGGIGSGFLPPDAFALVFRESGQLDHEVSLGTPLGSETAVAIVARGIGFGSGSSIGRFYLLSQSDNSGLPSLHPVSSYSGGTDFHLAVYTGGPPTLRMATYLGTSGDDFGGGLAVDRTMTAIAVGRTVSVRGGEDARIAAVRLVPTADSVVLTEDDSTSPLIKDNDEELAGAEGTLIIDTPPTHAASFDFYGAHLQYTPAPDYNGPDSLTYRITDGESTSAPATVTITVNPVNDRPRPVADAYVTDEDFPLTVSGSGVLANDLEVDGETLSAQLVSGPNLGGSLSFASDGSFVYTPRPNFSGTETFKYLAIDSSGMAALNSTTVTITVNPLPDHPTAVAFATDEDTPLAVPAPGVLANDLEVGGGTMSAQLASAQNAVGSLSLAPDGSFLYTPLPNSSGTDHFAYYAVNALGVVSQTTTTVTLTVNAVNDPPVAGDDVFTMDEDAAASIPVLANDVDVESSPTILAAGPAANGTVTFTSTSLSYKPFPNFNGTDTFSYTIQDFAGATDTAEVTVTVLPVNDAPTGAADAYVTTEDTPLSVAAPGVLGNDSDVDGDPIQAVLVLGLPGLALALDGSFSYTPPANLYTLPGSPLTFQYRARDPLGVTSAVITSTIAVNAVNDPPSAVNDARTVAEDSAPLSIAVLTNDSDAESGTLSIVSAGPAANGAVSFTATTVTYQPVANFHGTDTFDYTIQDPEGTTATATVTVTVTSVNDAPVAVADSFATDEDTPLSVAAPGVLGNDVDVDGDVLQTNGVVVFGAALGTFALAPDGSLQFTPFPNVSGVVNFQYRAVDPFGAFSPTVTSTLTIAAVNDLPVAAGDSVTLAEDAPPTSIAVLANDSDVEGAVTIVSAGPAANGLVAFSATSVTYQPVSDFNGTDSVSYTIQDGEGATATATVTVTVTSVNDPPVAADDGPFFVNEDDTLAIAATTLLGNDTDVDFGDTSAIVSLESPSHGTATLIGASVFYTPQPDFFGSDAFVYAMQDAAGATSSATVLVEVLPLDDPPRPQGDAFAMSEDTVLAVQASVLLTNDLEVDGQSLAVTAVHSASVGTVAFDGTTVTFAPPPDFFGLATFVYDVTDGTTPPVAATVTVTVTNVNDAPVVASDAFALPDSGTLVVAAPGVIANDADVDGEALAAELASPPTYGTLSMHPLGGFSYVADGDFPGLDVFTYRARDAAGATALATVTLTGAPRSADELVSTAEDTPVVVDVAANDPGADLNPPPETEVAYCYDGYDADCGGSDAPGTAFAAGRLTRVTDKPGAVAFAYDGAGRQVREARTLVLPGETRTLVSETAFDPNGNPVSKTHPTGVVVERVFDETDREVSVAVRSPGGVTTPLLAVGGGGQGEGWYPFGGLRAWRAASGTLAFTIEQDASGWVTRTSVTSVAPGESAEATYRYASDGNVIAIDSPLANNVGHDSLGRITFDRGSSYSYDDAGNRLSGPGGAVTYPNPSSNRWSSAESGAIAYSFDAAGSVTQRGELSLVTADDGTVIALDSPAGGKSRFFRDHRNLRVANSGVSGNERFVHSSTGDLELRLLEPIAEPCGTGQVREVTPVEHYVYLGGRRVAMVAGRLEGTCGSAGGAAVASVGAGHFYFADKMDLARAVYRESDGRAMWRGDFDAFGVPVGAGIDEDPDNDGVAFMQAFRLPGQQEIRGTDLNENWNRVFDSVVGRYLQPDPIGQIADRVLYRYTENRPLILIDPTGRDVEFIDWWTSPWSGYPHGGMIIDIRDACCQITGQEFWDFAPGTGGVFGAPGIIASTSTLPSGGKRTRYCTTCDQDKAALAEAQRLQTAGLNYNVVTQNCFDFVDQVLNAAGISGAQRCNSPSVGPFIPNPGSCGGGPTLGPTLPPGSSSGTVP